MTDDFFRFGFGHEFRLALRPGGKERSCLFVVDLSDDVRDGAGWPGELKGLWSNRIESVNLFESSVRSHCASSKSEQNSGPYSPITKLLVFRLIFAYAVRMWNLPEVRFCDFTVRCNRCGENIPAPVETSPDTWIVAECPLCGDCRTYLPLDIFRGRLSYSLVRKPVGSESRMR